MSADNPITLEQQRKVWTIHQSVNGLTYYYNRATKKSQYQMPECFKTTQQDLQHPEWKQYRTAEGKKFYYNANTRKSCWQLPAQVKQYKLRKQIQRKKAKQQNGNISPQHQILTQAQQHKRAFLQLLKHKGISVNTKWQTCIKICQEDDRWNLLKISDKKKYFNEYIGQLRKISQMQKKAKTQVNKAQFIKMLKQCKTLTSDAKMHRVSFDFLADSRWKLLEGKQKQEAFQQYMDQLYQKQKQDQKQKKYLNIQNLKKCLQEDQTIKYNTRWDDFIKMYSDNPFYRELNQYDRISTFVDYIILLEKKHDDQAIKENKLRERVNRINFRNLIKDSLCSGQITYKTKWRAFVKQFKDNQDLLNMMDPNQQGTSAHEIFEHLLDQVRQNHKKIKTDIKHHFKKKSFKMTQQTTSEQFNEKLQDLQNYEKLNNMLKNYFYCYFKQKIKSKNAYRKEMLKKNARKEKKAIFKIFKQMKEIKNKYTIDEQHIEKIQKSLEELGIQMARENIFNYRLQFLEEDNNDQQKRKKKDKDDSHSDSQSEQVIKKKKKKQQSLQKGKRHHSNTRQKHENNDNDFQQQGEIKDEDDDIQKKKKIKKVKRKNSSSSDSD